MGAQDRDYMKASVADLPPEDVRASRRPAWLDRLNEIGEKHATPIISVSTALIILIVLIFSKHYYDKAQLERAGQELSSAETVDQFADLKRKYGSTPLAPLIQAGLANRLHQEGKLEAARTEYREFQSRFGGHPLAAQTSRALETLEKNLKFEAEGKDALLREVRLRPHPLGMASAADPKLAWGPVASVKPTAELDLPGGTIKIELFEDEAPNAVASFIRLAEAGHFDGLAFEDAGAGRALTAAKAPASGEYRLAAESAGRAPEPGSLVLLDGADGHVAGRFAILTAPAAGLAQATVFGRIVEGLPAAQALKKDDAIRAARITSKRDHAYEPVPLKK
jgi:peptidyl-prolyl cis-trans isomerase B (cyclophilin B)